MYIVKINGEINKNDLDSWLSGIDLDDKKQILAKSIFLTKIQNITL